jgi:hypothetical protein
VGCAGESPTGAEMRGRRQLPVGLAERIAWAERFAARRNRGARCAIARLTGWPRSQAELPADPFAQDLASSHQTHQLEPTTVLTQPDPSPTPPAHRVQAHSGAEVVSSENGVPSLEAESRIDWLKRAVWDGPGTAIELPGLSMRTCDLAENGATPTASERNPHSEHGTRPSRPSSEADPSRQVSVEKATVVQQENRPGNWPEYVEQPGATTYEPVPLDIARSSSLLTSPTGDGSTSAHVARPRSSAVAAVGHEPDQLSPAIGSTGPAPSVADVSASPPRDAGVEAHPSSPYAATRDLPHPPGQPARAPESLELDVLADAVAQRLRDREMFDRTKRGVLPWQR